MTASESTRALPAQSRIELRIGLRPLLSRRFWVVLTMTAAVFAFHLLADGDFGVSLFPPAPRPATFVLFIIPIILAAVSFGERGSMATVAAAVVLMGIDAAMDRAEFASSDYWIIGFEVAVFILVAVVLGQRVEAEQSARRSAELARERLRREQTAAYAARVLRGQEEERRRIAQELHDDPVQVLVHLCRLIDRARTRLPEASPALQDLDETRAVAQGAIRSLREIASGLRPPALDDLGLLACLRRLVVDFEKRTGVRSEFTPSGLSRRLLPETELVLFRITQEALTNVEHHARAQHVEVTVETRDHDVSVTVADDGDGFHVPDPGIADPGKSLGLLGTRERARLVGGEVEIKSEHGEGTRLVVSVPC